MGVLRVGLRGDNDAAADNQFASNLPRRSANHCLSAACVQPVNPPEPLTEQLLGRTARAYPSRLSTADVQEVPPDIVSASVSRRSLGIRYRSLSGAGAQTIISSPTASGHLSSPKVTRKEMRSGGELGTDNSASALTGVAVARSNAAATRTDFASINSGLQHGVTVWLRLHRLNGGLILQAKIGRRLSLFLRLVEPPRGGDSLHDEEQDQNYTQTADKQIKYRLPHDP